MMGAGLAPVPGQADPGLSLGCLPQTAEVADLCLLLRAVIEAASPGRPVQMIDAEPHPETTIAIRLHVERLKKDAIAVHLEWRQPGQNWQRGETTAMNVMDRDLNDRMIARFFETLWAESPAGK